VTLDLVDCKTEEGFRQGRVSLTGGLTVVDFESQNHAGATQPCVGARQLAAVQAPQMPGTNAGQGA
jgi:hypothetical protein